MPLVKMDFDILTTERNIQVSNSITQVLIEIDHLTR